MYWDWFWYGFVTLWAVLVVLKLYQICKRRNMVAEQRRRQQTQQTRITVTPAANGRGNATRASPYSISATVSTGYGLEPQQQSSSSPYWQQQYGIGTQQQPSSSSAQYNSQFQYSNWSQGPPSYDDAVATGNAAPKTSENDGTGRF